MNILNRSRNSGGGGIQGGKTGEEEIEGEREREREREERKRNR